MTERSSVIIKDLERGCSGNIDFFIFLRFFDFLVFLDLPFYIFSTCFEEGTYLKQLKESKITRDKIYYTQGEELPDFFSI